eukprot:gene57915-biopygen108882
MACGHSSPLQDGTDEGIAAAWPPVADANTLTRGLNDESAGSADLVLNDSQGGDLSVTAESEELPVSFEHEGLTIQLDDLMECLLSAQRVVQTQGHREQSVPGAYVPLQLFRIDVVRRRNRDNGSCGVFVTFSARGAPLAQPARRAILLKLINEYFPPPHGRSNIYFDIHFSQVH